MEYIKVKTNELIPYVNNARTHDETQIKKIQSSIREFGFINPVVIDDKNNIIAGHGRVQAALKEGITEVPCIKESHLSEYQKKAYILADNKLAELSGWDFDLLANELEELKNSEIDIDMLGFDDFEYEEIEEETEREEKKEINYFTKAEIIEDVKASFVKYENVEEYVKNIMNVAKAKHQYNRLCGGYQDGYNISLLFNPHRLDTPTLKSMSIFQAINENENYRKAFSKYLVNVQNKVVTENEYYKFIGIGSGGVQYVNEFPPYLARDIYKKYIKNGDKILDPCSGWGGRTLGLSSLQYEDIEYITSDPSVKTYSGLLKLKSFLKLGENFKYNNCGFEDLEVKENYFDFCFTSPPYFDTERYSQDEKQSFKKNSNYEEWKINFLYVMLDKIFFALKKDKKCLLNVGKVRYPIDDDIIKYLKDNKKPYRKINDFKIGGAGIGARTDEDGKGEPFIEFTNAKEV